MADADSRQPESKVKSLDYLLSQLRSGQTIILGGFGMVRKPMAVVRAIAASDLTDLTVVSVGGSLDVELLIAAGKVKKVIYSYVGLDQFGLAPQFRRVRESAAIEVQEGSEYMIIAGLQAAASSLPFMPVRSGLGSDLPKTTSAYQTFAAPFTGETLMAVRAIEADVAIIHVNYADSSGYGWVTGDYFVDELYAMAASKVFLTTEKLVDKRDMNALHNKPTVLRLFVDGVVEVPFGAHPTSCYPDYASDAKHVGLYLGACKDQASITEYLHKYAALSPDEYLQQIERPSTISRA